MSKAEATGGQSLEEILSSIRKSLAHEPPAAQDPDKSEEAAVAPPAEVKSEVRQGSADAAPKPKEALPSWVTGASSDSTGAGKSAAARDDDLADLFDDPKSAPPAEATDAAPAAGAAATRESDPLWFLTRRPDAPAAGAEAKAAAPEAAKEPEPAAKSEPAKAEPVLTRPETIRSSLPPFFGSRVDPPLSDGSLGDRIKAADLGFMRPRGKQDGSAVPPPAAGPALPVANGTAAMPVPAAADPVQAKPAVAGAVREPEQARRETAAAEPAPAPVASVHEAAPVAAATPLPVIAAAPIASAAPTDVPAAGGESKPAPAPSPAQRPAPVSPGVDAMPPRTGNEAAPANVADTAAAGDRNAPQAHALEGMVMDMLQPMLRDWCDKNLPRLVETALKEEVARTVKGTRDPSET